jgi:hypothetical protein
MDQLKENYENLNAVLLQLLDHQEKASLEISVK